MSLIVASIQKTESARALSPEQQDKHKASAAP